MGGFITKGEKIVSLKEAGQIIQDGNIIAVGGALSAREPIALIHEIIRQGKKNLMTIGGAHGLDIDLLCAGGVVGAVQNSFVGFEFDFGLAPNYRRACQSGKVQVRETDCNFTLQQLRAAQYGIPFMPMPRVGGTDILQLHPEFKTITCPFTGEKLTAVPALKPDVAIIHGYKADKRGNVHLTKPYFADVLMATAAEKTIVTVEEVVSEEEIRELGIVIPYYEVTAVVEVPFGAHPTACYPAYAYDRKHIAKYIQLAQEGEEIFRREYLDVFVYGSETQQEYLRRVGDEEHFKRLRAWRQDITSWMEVFGE
ncbi:Glutaconate CoA-transferase subunit A [Neomoorella glycerini]|uniref:Glutaconate CoA-transferase subunit A n=1 Tax=Neomoorella glycerini TaxID=55779 RepID=A0A6I5ZNX9_9FIRM|nr:Glutaconate CoA-transferase subunit A [Moorella glycerini]